MPLSIFALFALAALAPSLHRRAPRAAAATAAAGSAIVFAAYLLEVPAGDGATWVAPWVPGLGVEVAFLLDGWSRLFALLVTGVGSIVSLYAGSYLRGDPRLGRLLAAILFFMGSMLGLVLADDAITLFVFWELTSVSSYLLVGFDHEDEKARKAALQALLVTGGGGLALLVGLLVLGSIAGTLRLSALAPLASTLQAHTAYPLALALVLLGALTKSAQVPFHFWLPGAMKAPAPVSALLHSATMVKAGIFLLARLDPALGGTAAWHQTLTIVGAATMLLGAWLAFRQQDLKPMLAYTTVSALGTATLLIGIGTRLAIKAAAVFLIVHALYKGALFLIAGILDHQTGTRDLRELGGLRRAMPVTAAIAALSCLSMAGLPPLFGFVAKELVYEAKLGAPSAPGLVTAAGLLAGALTVAIAATIWGRAFLGASRAPRPAREAGWPMLVGPAAMATCGVAFGMFPDALAGGIVQSVVAAVRAEPAVVELKLWHGFTVVLGLSVATLAAGALLYRLRDRWIAATARFAGAARFGPEHGARLAAAATIDGALRLTAVLQDGRLRRYVRLALLSLLAAGLVPSLVRGGFVGAAPPWGAGPLETSIALSVVVAAAYLSSTDSRLAAVAALGAVGAGVSLVFVRHGGPDLAMTQFAVETLSVLLFVFVLWRLPKFLPRTARASRARDAALALACGALFALLLAAATSTPHASELAGFFADRAVPDGRGRNVVNVILVDFRAMDTLGEITVLAAAALGVVALVRPRGDREAGA